MSRRLVVDVLERSTARGIDKLTLMVVASFANDDDIAWPHNHTIARLAGIAKSTACDSLFRLTFQGYLVELERQLNKGREIVVRQVVPIPAAGTVEGTGSRQARYREPTGTVPKAGTDHTGSRYPHKKERNQSRNQVKEPSGANAPAAPARAREHSQVEGDQDWRSDMPSLLLSRWLALVEQRGDTVDKRLRARVAGMCRSLAGEQDYDFAQMIAIVDLAVELDRPTVIGEALYSDMLRADAHAAEALA